MIGLRDVLFVAPAASFHSQQHHHHPNEAAAAAPLLAPTEHPVIPVLAAAPCLIDDPDGRGRVPTGINLWQNPPAQQLPARTLENNPNPNPIGVSSYFGKPMPVPMFDSTSPTTTGALMGSPGGNSASVGALMGVGLGGAGIGAGPSSSLTCQDCGNQAKKDCSHRRCRTCCKSRGFDCATHIKSTWVPAARRRERQMSAVAVLAGAEGGGGGAAAVSSASTSVTKKPRLVSSDAATGAATANTNATTSRTSTSNTNTPPRSFDTGSSHQDASFRESLPGQVKAPAVFKCVRVTTVDDGEDEFAYQAMVRIGGHIFKGFLYDQGLVEAAGTSNTGGHDAPLCTSGGHDDGGANTSRNNSGSMPNISELHLGGAAVGGGGPSDVYAAANVGGALIGGAKGLILGWHPTSPF